jgi:cytochrome c553
MLVSGAPAVGDARTAQSKAVACGTCHGADGNSALPLVPSLAGQPAYYITLQLVLFRDKQRDVPQMTPFAAGLTDTDAEEIGAYFAGLSAKPAAGSLNELTAAEGERLAEGKHCASCHREGYGGRDQIPRLAGQREDYLVKAMQDYRDGKRAGFDGTMTEVLRGVSDDNLTSLAHYLAHLR